MGDQLPDTKVPDTQETFENRSQENAEEASDSQTASPVLAQKIPSPVHRKPAASDRRFSDRLRML